MVHPLAIPYLAASPYFSVKNSSSFILKDTWGKVGVSALHIPDVSDAEKKDGDPGHPPWAHE